MHTNLQLNIYYFITSFILLFAHQLAQKNSPYSPFLAALKL